MNTQRLAIIQKILADRASSKMPELKVIHSVPLSFPQQDAFIDDPAQFIAALCTRQAGKSNGLGGRFLKTMHKYPSSLCRYIALTRDSAKDIMWPVLEELHYRRNIQVDLVESKLTMILKNNGARLRLYGADMKNFVRRLRGVKSPGTGVDEAQEFEPAHLKNLVDDILTPCMTFYSDGWLALTGTPGPIPRGMFFEITEHGQSDYSLHKWSLYDNPYLPNARDFVEKLKRKHKWADNNPTLLREWLGQWVLDLDSLLIRYNHDINHFERLDPKNWETVMGIDMGFNDADAIAILAWSENDPCTFLVDEFVMEKQGLSELVDQIQRLSKKYNVSKMVIDEGGLGKKLAEEMRRRHGIPVQPADKQRKFENVALLNDALRVGKFKAPKTSRFVEDSYKVQIDWEKTTPDRIVVKKGFHSDIIDAVLYAFRESPAFAYQAPKLGPKYGSKEWADQQVDEMELAAEAHFKRLEGENE